jgi:trimethylamine--corrinoid protein Co-methyltransferase
MWGVPTLAGLFGTDALEPGWQSASESAACLLLCALCGAETGSGMGLLESCTVLYPEELVLDTDIYHRVRTDAAGLDTSRQALALDVVKAVGPRGHFLGQRHTRDHMRKREFSDLTAQLSEQGGYRDPIEVAQEKTNWILENHHPEPLDEAKQAELKRILQVADQELA